MKHLWVLLFIARVSIPWGLKVTIEGVQSVFVDSTDYRLVLVDGRTVFVPTMFTVIEEQK